MKERPILFSAPMVRAILSDDKTQTRRALNPQPRFGADGCWYPDRKEGRKKYLRYATDAHFRKGMPVDFPRYGPIGDRLWVRETLKIRDSGNWEYAADHAEIEMDSEDARAPEMISWAHHKEGGTCVSIHMPRWASRITLEVTALRVERLCEISETDAMAEGVDWKERAGLADYTARKLYRVLWEEINGAGSWDANPWVWVVTFKRALES